MASKIQSKLIALKPLRCEGYYSSGGKEFSTVYLSREGGLEIIDDGEEDENSATIRLCDVVPVPLFEKMGNIGTFNNQFTNSIINRDKGIYDNLPYASWFPASPLIKKSFYDTCMQLQLFKSSIAPEEAFIRSLNSVLGGSITGLLLEIADEMTPTCVTLGASVLLGRNDASSLGQQEADACIVHCHKDELVRLALHTQKPIFISKSLFHSLAVDAELERGIQSVIRYRNPGTGTPSNLSLPSSPPAWDIFSPDQFLRMKTLEKRSVLRASGITDLPRPRQGEGALDAAMYTLMDAAVRQEVARRRAGLPAKTSSTSNGDRASLLQGIAAALSDGNVALAESLREQFARKTMLRADPTQEEGSYDRHLDQDEWYEKERRRAMAPKKK